MGVYSNTEIRAAIDDGTIVSVPFNPHTCLKQASTSRLGIIFINKSTSPKPPVYTTHLTKTDVARYFKGPLEAMPHKAWCEKIRQATI